MTSVSDLELKRRLRIREAATAGAVFLLALVVRLIYLHEIAGSPTFDVPLVDSMTYDRLARSLAAGRGPSDELFWQPFFYPVFLAVVYYVTDSSLWWAQVIQMVLGAGTCVLTYRLGAGLLGRVTGVVAGILTALYGPLIFHDGELLGTGWACFWSVALLLLFPSAARRARLDLCLAAGLCAGLATLTRPNFLPFAVATTAWMGLIWSRRRVGRGRVAAGMTATVLGFLLVTLPVAWWSGRVTGRASFLPASGGINLYIGNHPRSSELLAIRPGWEWFRLTLLPGFHGIEHKEDSTRFFQARVREYATSAPLGFLSGLARKSVQLVSSRELPRNLDIYVQRDGSQTLRLLVWKVGQFGFPFGVLFPLALVGAAWHARRLGAPLWLFLVLYGASVVLVFVAGRYRAPMVPALAVPAAAGLLALLRWIGERDARRLAAAGAAVGFGVLLGSLPGPFPQEATDYRAELSYLLGRRAADAGDAGSAVRLLEDAIERQPRHSDAHCALGAVLLGRQQLEAAGHEFALALEIDPGHAIARGNLGRVLARQGDLSGAARHLRAAVEANPWDADLQRDLGQVFRQLRSIGAGADP